MPVVAARRRGRAAEDLGGLLNGEAREEPQLDEPGLSLVEGGELLEGLVKGEEVDRPGMYRDVDGLDREVLLAPAPLSRVVPTGVVDQNLTHRAGSHPVEMSAILQSTSLARTSLTKASCTTAVGWSVCSARSSFMSNAARRRRSA